MHIGLTLVTPRQRRDVWLAAPPDATVDDLTKSIERHLRRKSDGLLALYRGRELLDPSWPVAQLRLHHGEQIGVGAPLPANAPAAGTHVVAVVDGVDAGVVVPAGGDVTVGRDDGCDVVLTDPAVSRQHVRISATEGGWTVTDLDSSTGTFVDGQRVATTTPLAPDQPVRIGNTVLALRGYDVSPAVVDSVDGVLLFNRPPRFHPPSGAVEVEFPTKPSRAKVRLSWAVILAPLLMGGVMVAMGMDKRFLAFALLSPVMSLAGVAGDAGPLKRRRQAKTYDAERRAAFERLASALADEESARRAAAPDLATLTVNAVGRSRRLWERRATDDDFLSVRVGVADRPATVAVSGDADGAECVVRDVPLTLDVASAGVVGVAGPAAAGRALLRAVAAQVLALHSPRDVRLVVLAGGDGADDWQSLKWAPHVVVRNGARTTESWLGLDPTSVALRLAELSKIINQRTERAHRRDAEDAFPRYVVVLDGVPLTSHPGLTSLLSHGPAVGIYTVCRDDRVEGLPEDCRAIVRTSEGGGAVSVQQADGSVIRDVIVDGCSQQTLAAISTSVAALFDTRAGGSDASLPASVRLLELAGIGEPTAADIATRWGTPGGGRSTRALLGVAETGPLYVDLRTDGPHGLVAGTTGAGKSELLQTLIASLALANRPDALTFVLVDYKGGSAFKDCALLPHTVGTVTDLDGHLVERALTSLTAELKRREALFADAGVKDLEEYWQTPSAQTRPLARLLIVVDEFASLVEEVPDFVKGLVGIGMRGRSLGVHMILATQRPAGVVTADIRANTNLRICLRVASAGDSADVIDSPDAATISRATPGRGYLRTGHGDLAMFQAARVGGTAATPQAQALTVADMSLESLQPEAATALSITDDEAGSSDLSLLVKVISEAAEQLEVQAHDSPWLDPLPPLVELSRLDATSSPGLAIALQDLPQDQRYGVRHWWPPRDGHLLAVGGPQSGRSTLLRTIAAGIATTWSPADAHVYVLDAGNRTLAHLGELPHVGAVVGSDELERVRRLLSFLGTEVRRRQRLLAEVGVTDLEELRGRAGETPARLFLLVDKYDAYLAAVADLDGGRLVEELERLLRDGPQVGLYVAMTSDRTGVSARLASAIAAKLVLRMADKDDYLRMGVPPRKVPSAMPPGRALWLDGIVEMQVASPSADPSGVAQRAALAEIAAVAAKQRVDAASLPRRIDALPSAVTLSRLASYGQPADGEWTLGLGGDELHPLGVTLHAASPGLLVGGPPASGRSTALLTALHGAPPGALQRGPVAVLSIRPSVLREAAALPGVTVLTSESTMAADLLALGVGNGPSVLVVDDAELLVDSMVSPTLDDIVRRARDTETWVLAAGAGDVLSTSFKPWVAELRKVRTGVVLSPVTPMDGGIFGLTLPRSALGDTTPGRGLLVVTGASTPIQIALPT